jgi:ribonuclease Z
MCGSKAQKAGRNSCRKFAAHFADGFIQSGEIAERRTEDKERLEGGPAELVNLVAFDPKDEPQLVWSSDAVKVSAVRSTHIAGHASFRVDTPAGSVVIGGDAGNDLLAPPRTHSTSDQVEKLANAVDIIVHSAFHPIMGPDQDSGMPPPIFYRQSLASEPLFSQVPGVLFAPDYRCQPSNAGLRIRQGIHQSRERARRI